MKKKIASLSMLLCLLAVFFVIPVHAENTYVRELRNYSNSISSASLTYSVTAAQFGYVTESTLNGGMHSPILVTARLTNNGSNDVKIANSYIDLTFTTYSQVSAYDCYTSDLMVQMVKNGNDTPRYNIVASNGYSYGGHIVVPAHSSLYLVFEVDIEASYNTSTASVTSPSLDAVLLSINSSDVITGDYPTTGSIPEQIDELETYVSQLAGYTYANGQSLANITSILIDIKNQIRFTGTFVVPTSSVASTKTISGSYGTTVSMTARAIRYPSYILSYDFEEHDNTVDQAGYKRIVYVININIISQEAFTHNTIQVALPFSRTTSSQPYVYDLQSNIFTGAYVYNANLFLRTSIANPRNYNYQLFPAGKSYAVVTLYLDIPVDALVPDWIDPSTPFDITYYSAYNGYVPNSIESGVSDIYNYITSPSQQNTDTVTESNNAGSMSDQVHAQEEQWYRENDTAMENVGLSNYRYTQNQQNGIVGAVLQFEQMWHALGDWTLVYIFTLMLSLAVFILRHEPTTRMKQARAERSAFYAEAGRYYRESAKPSNEFVQRVRKFNGK